MPAAKQTRLHGAADRRRRHRPLQVPDQRRDELLQRSAIRSLVRGCDEASRRTGDEGPVARRIPARRSTVQRERDDVRKRVLTEELRTEVAMLVESEVAMKNASQPIAGRDADQPAVSRRVKPGCARRSTTTTATSRR
jgi:hypothetical protein